MIDLRWLHADGVGRELQYRHGMPVYRDGLLVPGEFVWGEWLTVQPAAEAAAFSCTTPVGDFCSTPQPAVVFLGIEVREHASMPSWFDALIATVRDLNLRGRL